MSLDLNDTECDYLFKAVLIGDSGVGKSNLLSRFSGREFQLDSKPTIGVEFAYRNVRIGNKLIKAQVWDTAGQERYRAIITSYYRGALGALLVYDITRRSTFDSLKNWLAEIRKFNNSDTVVVLIANKSDLKQKREVSQHEGLTLAEKEGLCFMETSALDNTNVEEAFVAMVSQIYEVICQKTLEQPVENAVTPRVGEKLVNIGDEVSATKQTKCCY